MKKLIFCILLLLAGVVIGKSTNGPTDSPKMLEIDYVIHDITVITKDGVKIHYQMMLPRESVDDAHNAAVQEALEWTSDEIEKYPSKFNNAVRIRFREKRSA